MTLFAFPTQTAQIDEACRLLADFYTRQFQISPSGRVGSQGRSHAAAALRDLFRQASDPHEALTRLQELQRQPWSSNREFVDREAEEVAWQASLREAQEQVAQVIQAGGSAQVLLAGETDGFRHLCLRCSQDEQNFQRVRFFHHRVRRPLLNVEVSGRSRSLYSRCQICQQALAPAQYVVLIPTGTRKHGKPCGCRDCNQAGLAWQMSVYAYERATQTFALPPLAQVVAPSRQQARERALTMCLRQGWYALGDRPEK